MKKYLPFALMIFPMWAFAQATGNPTTDFFNQAWALISSFGGMSFVAKIAAVVMLLTTALKVPFLSPIWDAFGNFKSFVPLLLSLATGIVSLSISGTMSWAGLAAYLFAGAGSVFLYEILDDVKNLPGISHTFQAIISFVENLLQPPAPPSPPAAPQA